MLMLFLLLIKNEASIYVYIVHRVIHNFRSLFLMSFPVVNVVEI